MYCYIDRNDSIIFHDRTGHLLKKPPPEGGGFFITLAYRP
ncbi:hypothetical protein [Moraxella phage Mcat18]|nr:hypothetical protein [Moraxella phage Mcat18]AKI27949.1 hypothetical protein [Moraxella phage Mcat22]